MTLAAADRRWRFLVTLAAAIAIFFAVRDALGLADAFPVSSAPVTFEDRLWGAVRLLMLAVAAAVAQWGTDRRRALLLSGALIGIALNNNWWHYSPADWLLLPSVALNYLGLAFGLALFLRFAATYSQADWHGVRRRIATAAPLIALPVAVFGTAWWVGILVYGHVQPLYNALFWYAWDIVNVLVVITSAIGIAKAPTTERRTMAWVAGSFMVGAAGTLLHGITRGSLGEARWAYAVDTIAQAAMALGLAYSMIRHRAFGFRFVVERAMFFTVLGGVLSVVFATIHVLIDQVVRHRVAGALAPVLSEHSAELAISIGAVLSIKRLESMTDRLAERMQEMPPTRERGLLRFAREEVAKCTSAIELTERLFAALERYADARAVALYRRVVKRFDRWKSTFSTAPPKVSATDPDVLAVETTGEPCRLSGEGALPLAMAFPMRTRGTLSGFVLCHREDEAPDAASQRAIRETVASAESAFEEFRVAELEREVARLREQRKAKHKRPRH